MLWVLKRMGKKILKLYALKKCLSKPMFLADPGCADYIGSTEYNGNMSVTANGRQCQIWSTIYPYNDTLEDDSRFPIDGTVIAAKNFCRDPTNEGNIWCYTTDPGVVWEYCRFLPCTYIFTNHQLVKGNINGHNSPLMHIAILTLSIVLLNCFS